MENTEKLLCESEDKFRRIVESSPLAMYFYRLEPDGRLILTGANPAADRIIGISHEQMHNKTIEEVFPKLKDTPIPEMYRKVAAGELGPQSFEIEYRDEQINGYFDVHVFSTGEATIAVNFQNITERKQLEEKIALKAEEWSRTLLEKNVELEAEVAERQQAQRELSAKNSQLDEISHHLAQRISSAVAEIRAKDELLILQSRQSAMGEMIGNIAHQWRQPLNNIGLLVQLLQRICNSGEMNREEMNRQFDTIMSIIMYMSKTVDDFRNYFAPDKAKVSFSLSRMIKQSLELISAAFENIGIRIDVENCAMDTVRGYPNEFAQVMLVILGNARDQLLEHEVIEPRIAIRTFSRGDCIVVSIRDNGGGIQEDVLPKIFDPYFTTKEQGKGTGIGLYMSKMIIEKHMGGVLTAMNLEGGAEFRIELPREA